MLKSSNPAAAPVAYPAGGSALEASASPAALITPEMVAESPRVRNPDMIKFDIHDRVNYAVTKSFLNVDEATRTIVLELTVDNEISQVMEYFEIFMTRMLACRKAAKFLGTSFGLVVNGNRLT